MLVEIHPPVKIFKNINFLVIFYQFHYLRNNTFPKEISEQHYDRYGCLTFSDVTLLLSLHF